MQKKKLLIITDTTEKQTNGVVRTLKTTTDILNKDFDIYWINPHHFNRISLPFYKEIDISLNVYKIGNKIECINPDYIHIATEGPVGLAGKLYCDKKGYNYTTSYHSMFPEFIQDMFKVPSGLTYPYFRWFHSKSKNVLVPTNKIKQLLMDKGFNNLIVWKRGVDRKAFNSTYRNRLKGTVLKIILCVSRISKEKGLDDFCKIPIPDGYLKVLVGDGPYLKELMNKYHSEAIAFVGKRTGKDLAETYANADVFIFPSKNDTFGLTQLEAIASGTPVLAYKGTVSEEIIKEGKSGYLVDDFGISEINAAMELSRKYVEDESYNWTWKKCTEIFKNNLVEK
jgi:glycosyltransferase involved in cell wall biosynthesis